MAKKTTKKLALKRETLRSLGQDELRAAAGGSIIYYNGGTIYGQGGIIGTSFPPPPTGDTWSISF
jgi:hypothetical protein